MKKRGLARQSRYLLEAALLHLACLCFRLLGIDRASTVGGAIARRIGPLLSATRTARRNLRMAFPDMDDAGIEKIILGMWENLGRTAAEFSFISSENDNILISRTNVMGAEHIDRVKRSGKGAILFSGHFGNWEITPKIMFERGMPLMFVYRPANNSYVDRLIVKSRLPISYNILPKGSKAAREIMAHLKRGGFVGMLVDQKMNEGIAVPFFGRDAMTAPALAEFSLRHGAALVPGRIVRKKGAFFDLVFYPPLATEGKTAPAIMTEVNALLEQWIREKPEQWFWLHKRWPAKSETEIMNRAQGALKPSDF